MDGGIPVIKVQLQGMKHTIVHAITEYTARQDTEIKAGIEAAIDGFDVRQEVQAQATDTFRSVMREVVSDAMREALWKKPELRQQIVAEVAKQVSKYLKTVV